MMTYVHTFKYYLNMYFEFCLCLWPQKCTQILTHSILATHLFKHNSVV